MPFRKVHLLIPIVLGILLLGVFAFLWPTTEASAQCGSQASSCKNCHEVQGQDPVNSDGTGWHQSHAFGDFCYICHAGNNQSMDQDAAHTGMVAPMSDVKTGCQSCHPNDLTERAQVYATALGVEIGMGGGPAAPSSGPEPGGDQSAPAAAPPSPVGMVVDDAEVIDYNLRYSGEMATNWGNIILVVLIGLVSAGGGTYVIWNERKLRGLDKAAPKADPAQPAAELPRLEGYAPEVVALLPLIAQLNPAGLHALRRLLENPAEAAELLHSLSRLDPELVRRIRSLDRDSRALLLALSGD